MPVFFFGPGRGPNRGGGNLIFIIFLVMMFGPGALIIPALIQLLPFVALALAGVGVAKLIKSLVNSNKNNKASTSFRTNKKETRYDNLSNYDLTRIDKKLTNYFKYNVVLPVINDIGLVTSNGKYTSVDNLFLTYKDEKVVKLADFKTEHYSVYSKIMSLLVEFSKQSDNVMSAKVETPAPKKEDVLSDAQKYINKINDLNAQIPQEEITNGLYQTCDLLNKIELSKQSKQDAQKLTKLYDYYLPILTGILENYKNLQDRAIKDEEFTKCESQLIKTIMLINQALKTLYGEMHEDDYLNINADMDTLQTLIKKDGFTEDPFKAKK